MGKKERERMGKKERERMGRKKNGRKEERFFTQETVVWIFVFLSPRMLDQVK